MALNDGIYKEHKNMTKLLNFRIEQGRAESPMEHIAQGKRSGTLGIAYWSNRAL